MSLRALYCLETLYALVYFQRAGSFNVVLAHKGGENLSHVWDSLVDRERLHVREECEKAIHILHSLSIYVPDAGKHNVL